MALTAVDLASAYQNEAEKFYAPEREALKKQYSERLSETQKSYTDAINYYNSMFDPLKSSYIAQQSAYKTQANYDISQAYTNYKKQQLNLLQTQRLGTGLKEELGSELQSSYKSIFSQLKEQEQQNLYNAAQNYAKNVTDLESEIQSQKNAQIKAEESLEKTYNEGVKSIDTAVKDYADKSVALTNALLDFARESEDNQDINLDWLVKQGYIKSTNISTDENGRQYEDYEITDYGKDYLAQKYFKRVTKKDDKGNVTYDKDFMDYIEEQVENATTEKEKQAALDLLTFLSENETRFKDSLGLYTIDENGIKKYDVGYDENLGKSRRFSNKEYTEKFIEDNSPKHQYSDNFWGWENTKTFKNYVENEMEKEYKKYIKDLGLNFKDYEGSLNLIKHRMAQNADDELSLQQILHIRRDNNTYQGDINIRDWLNSEIDSLNERIKNDALKKYGHQ